MSIKKYIPYFCLTVSLLTIAPEKVAACDVCSSSGSSQYIGMMSQLSGHIIGVQHQSRFFNSSFRSLFNPNIVQRYSDNYTSAQLWGRYQATSKLQLLAFVPYQYNVRKNDTGYTRTQGLADMSVMANYKLAASKADSGVKHTLFIATGIKLPTGRYTGISVLDQQGVPNMQPGTGSTDFTVNTNYTLSVNKYGINADVSYVFTTANSYDYKYGNKFSSGLTLFYQLQAGDFNILPQLGARYEYVTQDYSNYARKWRNNQSGGYLSYATAGVQASYNRIGARATFALPLAQHYADEQVIARYNMETGLFFLF